MRRRKRRLRIDRVLICLLVLVGLICIVRFTIYTIYGFKILNQAKKGETVKLYHDNANLWKSTVKYINENMDELTYTYRNYTVTMDSSYFKKNMNIKPSTENKKITNTEWY